MAKAPDRIFATVNGSITRMPDHKTWLTGGWDEYASSPRAIEYVRADIVTSPQGDPSPQTLVGATECIEKLKRLTSNTGRDHRSGKEFVHTGDSQEVVDAMRDAIALLGEPTPQKHVKLAEAVNAYLSAVDSEPENDIWDTWDGNPAEGASKTASDNSWAEHGQKIEACLSELRALATEGK